jgi:hypothetical protein
MNEASFDPLDVGMVDSTVHVLKFAGETKLFVEKRPLDDDATLDVIGRARTQYESERLSRLSVLSEREVEFGGTPMFDVAAYFCDEAEIVYQRRTHFIWPPWSFTLTLRGEMASRADLDARMDTLLATLRVRADD